MKKNLLVLLSLLVFSMAVNVQAASVTFEPPEIKLKIPAGKTGRTALTVHGYSNTAYSLNFLVGSRLKKGNLPRSWLTAAYLWLDAEAEGNSTATMDLVIEIPKDARPGTYTGLLIPDDMRSSETISSQGVYIAVEVPAP
jgi:hypothetical protein